MRLIKTILILSSLILAASCSKMGDFEAMPELSREEFCESICGTWNICCVGMHTEEYKNGTDRVVAMDTMTTAISSISYKKKADEFEITVSFDKDIVIEQTLVSGEKKTTTRLTCNSYTMYSSSADTFPLAIDRDDNGKEVFRTLTVQEGQHKHEHPYSYPVRYFGRDMIASFEIRWFILQADHLYYQFVKD